MDHRELQTRCKLLGIRANQSSDAMRAALLELDSDNTSSAGGNRRGKSKSKGGAGATAPPRILRHVRKDVLEAWRVERQLGAEGKDGQVFLVISSSSSSSSAAAEATRGAMKVFKPKKSVARIAAEVAFQSSAAAASLAPAVLSEWRIDEGHRCFVMAPLDRTLAEIVVAQSGVLTVTQTARIALLFAELSSQCSILHNDENVGLNIMERASDGELFLIDFGFARAITAKDLTKWGPNPNIVLLPAVDRLLVKRGGAKVYEGTVLEYEQRHGVTVDVRAKLKRGQAERMKLLLAKHRAKKKKKKK